MKLTAIQHHRRVRITSCPQQGLSLKLLKHAVLQTEFEAQGTENSGSSASRIVLLPTVVINDKQYRGRLDALSITKALCAGFKESTEPEVHFLALCFDSPLQSMPNHTLPLYGMKPNHSLPWSSVASCALLSYAMLCLCFVTSCSPCCKLLEIAASLQCHKIRAASLHGHQPLGC